MISKKFQKELARYLIRLSSNTQNKKWRDFYQKISLKFYTQHIFIYLRFCLEFWNVTKHIIYSDRLLRRGYVANIIKSPQYGDTRVEEFVLRLQKCHK